MTTHRGIPMVYFPKEYCFNVSLEKDFLAHQIRISEI